MKKIKVNLSKNSYEIIIGKNVISQLPKFIKRLFATRNAVIITNPTIKRIYSAKIDRIFKGSKISFNYLTVPDSETSKSLEYFTSTISRVSKIAGNKPIFIIALGGGVVGDLAGFVAAVYKRGVPYIQVPTTLLAQVDSAIGGKTAVDLSVGKNLVGAFYQPSLVISDTVLLKTLKPRQIKSGLAEVVKYAAIMDAKLFAYLKKNFNDILKLRQSCLERIIYYSSLHKSKIIEKDEKETKGIRTILNFGHTVGHALEAACKYKTYSHGEAVSVGMVAAAYISNKLGMLSRQEFERIKVLLNKIGLPIKARRLNAAKILKHLSFDKKFIRGHNRLVLLKRIGKAVVKEKVDPVLIKEAIKDVLV